MESPIAPSTKGPREEIPHISGVTKPLQTDHTAREVVSEPRYQMRISRMTVDKLGVRLYDTVSAVVAELIANSYDADATSVLVKVPLATALAQREADSKQWRDLGYVIEVRDNGHGMTREEANEHFLRVGRERRIHPNQGPLSRLLKRKVMGRKGIGKLAPFGICRRMEVISIGGEPTDEGYETSHFILDYNRILVDDDRPVELEAGELDGKFDPQPGTTIRLSNFLSKRVPASEIFVRQLARRFIPSPSFEITVEDTRETEAQGGPVREIIGPLDVPYQADTRIDLSDRPVTTEDGEELPVTGWLALAKDAYKDEETTGVRIYARNKIVGWTRDFEQPAGYTGEFTMRSYLIGEVTAEWLDLDDGEDLVRTDRQSIIWDSDYGSAFRAWGTALIKEMGTASRRPRRKRAKQIFFEVSGIEKRIREKYSDPTIVDAAMILADQIGGFAAEDELTDDEYVESLSSIILTVAPHSALMQAFQDFEQLSEKGPVEIHEMRPILRKSRIAEMASYGQIAQERVRFIESLEKIVVETTDESEFQKLIALAPWLIEPTWSVISENESLRTFKNSFEIWYRKVYGSEISLAIQHERKRPDFTLVDVGHRLNLVEIKPADHVFDDEDADRLLNYAQAFDRFFADHDSVGSVFPNGYRITLVADHENLKKASTSIAYGALVAAGRVRRHKWTEFLMRARESHEQFLRASRLFEESNKALEAEAAAVLTAAPLNELPPVQ